MLWAWLTSSWTITTAFGAVLARSQANWGLRTRFPSFYVPLLLITHVVALYMLLRPHPHAARAVVNTTAAF